MEAIILRFKSEIPEDIGSLDMWEKEREIDVRNMTTEIVKNYHNNFPEGEDPERNIMITMIAQDIGPKLFSHFEALRI